MRLSNAQRARRRILRPASAVALLAAAACGEQADLSLGPDLRLENAAVWITPLARATPLSDALTASVTVGSAGGRLVLPRAGLDVVIPANAVNRVTTISVTAVPGVGLTYTFAPHGLRFRVPLVVTQTLPGIHAGAADALALNAYYFDGQDAIDVATGRVRASEVLPVGVDVGRNTASFRVWHFSSYSVASGKNDGKTDGKGG
ncbi:MAG TPA: hypothetical protein VNA89_02090 [Gemmatimonadaceae bacterium]|nr:hypothetical protein [Gemmatimonadaceae bacterium]